MTTCPSRSQMKPEPEPRGICVSLRLKTSCCTRQRGDEHHRRGGVLEEGDGRLLLILELGLRLRRDRPAVAVLGRGGGRRGLGGRAGRGPGAGGRIDERLPSSLRRRSAGRRKGRKSGSWVGVLLEGVHLGPGKIVAEGWAMGIASGRRCPARPLLFSPPRGEVSNDKTDRRGGNIGGNRGPARAARERRGVPHGCRIDPRLRHFRARPRGEGGELESGGGAPPRLRPGGDLRARRRDFLHAGGPGARGPAAGAQDGGREGPGLRRPLARPQGRHLLLRQRHHHRPARRPGSPPGVHQDHARPDRPQAAGGGAAQPGRGAGAGGPGEGRVPGGAGARAAQPAGARLLRPAPARREAPGGPPALVPPAHRGPPDAPAGAPDRRPAGHQPHPHRQGRAPQGAGRAERRRRPRGRDRPPPLRGPRDRADGRAPPGAGLAEGGPHPPGAGAVEPVEQRRQVHRGQGSRSRSPPSGRGARSSCG